MPSKLNMTLNILFLKKKWTRYWTAKNICVFSTSCTHRCISFKKKKRQIYCLASVQGMDVGSWALVLLLDLNRGRRNQHGFPLGFLPSVSASPFSHSLVCLPWHTERVWMQMPDSDLLRALSDQGPSSQLAWFLYESEARTILYKHWRVLVLHLIFIKDLHKISQWMCASTYFVKICKDWITGHFLPGLNKQTKQTNQTKKVL